MSVSNDHPPHEANGNGAAHILHFDATIRRRDKMREKAEAGLATAPAPPEVAVAPAPEPQRAVPAATDSPPPAAPQPPAPKQEIGDLDTFLVNFVVEQTGYPPEIVEMEADLEADLGIDSIKKAQLFGELREYFDIDLSSATDMTLDDFPTLVDVRNFLQGSPAAPSNNGNGSATASSAGVPGLAEPAPAPPVPVAARQPESPPAPSAQPITAKQEIEDLDTFLVNFVVEQTGYPPEIVELDADLEADLGIDSIKKAQLFGELREYFDIDLSASADLTLDDFPTLAHVRDFLQGTSRASADPSPTDSSPPPAPPAPDPQPSSRAPTFAGSTTPAEEDLDSFLVNFVVEQTGYPPEIVEMDADLEADLGIDSIKKAQLFGELREYFEIDLASATDLSLDDFPTLAHVRDFLQGTRPKSDATS